MKTKEKIIDKIITILIFLSWLFILAVAVGDLFYVPFRSIVWFGSLIIVVFIYLKFRKIPKYIHLLLLFIALANIFGEVFSGFFYTHMNYDKILHFINPIMISIFVYYTAKDKIKGKNTLLMFCIFTALSASTIWELLEYGIDQTFGSYMQGVYLISHFDIFGIVARQTMDKLTDTMDDLFSGVLGLIVFTVGYYLNKKKSS